MNEHESKLYSLRTMPCRHTINFPTFPPTSYVNWNTLHHAWPQTHWYPEGYGLIETIDAPQTQLNRLFQQALNQIDDRLPDNVVILGKPTGSHFVIVYFMDNQHETFNGTYEELVKYLQRQRREKKLRVVK